MKLFLYYTLYAMTLATLVAMASAYVWAYYRYRDGIAILPHARPRQVPWGAGSIGVVVLTWVVVNFLTVQAFVAMTNHRPGADLTLPERMILGSLINVAVILALPTALRLTAGGRAGDLGVSPHGLARQAGVGAVAFLLTALPVNLINVLSTKAWKPHEHPIQMMVNEKFTWDIAYLAMLSAVIVAPAAEELFFRAIIQSWLVGLFERIYGGTETSSGQPRPDAEDILPDTAASESSGTLEANAAAAEFPTDGPPRDVDGATRAAIVTTSTLFALAHYEQWPAPIALFFLSLALGTVYARTGSLCSAFVFHALFNALSTMMLFLAILGQSVADQPPKAPAPEIVPPAVRPNPQTRPPIHPNVPRTNQGAPAGVKTSGSARWRRRLTACPRAGERVRETRILIPPHMRRFLVGAKGSDW